MQSQRWNLLPVSGPIDTCKNIHVWISDKLRDLVKKIEKIVPYFRDQSNTKHEKMSTLFCGGREGMGLEMNWK